MKSLAPIARAEEEPVHSTHVASVPRVGNHPHATRKIVHTMLRRPEPVLLVEEIGGVINFRVVILKHPVNQILERVHVSPTATATRLWRCTDGERDLTRNCRIFREVLPPAPPEAPERPMFDELVIKKPLLFS